MKTFTDLKAVAEAEVELFESSEPKDGLFLASTRLFGLKTLYSLNGDIQSDDAKIVGRVERTRDGRFLGFIGDKFNGGENVAPELVIVNFKEILN